MSEEQEKFRLMIEDLRERYTLQTIADEIKVSVRQVTNIINGDRPKGMVAIRLYLFHGKLGTRVP
jgi:plasmid maintenance system antidote protein VapI